MPRPRFENAPAELRRSILAAATREFAKRGYEGASLNRIIRASTLSKGSFYYYFDDKADLAATALAQVTRDIAPLLDLHAIVDAPSFWATMKRFQRSTLEPLAHDPAQLELIGKLATAYVDHPELAQRVLPLVSDYVQLALSAWRRGQEVGAVRDDLPVEELMAVMAATKEAVLKARLPRDGVLTLEEIDHLATLMFDFFRRLAAPPERSSQKEAV